MNRYDSFLIIEKYHDTFEYLCYMIIKNQVLVIGTLRKRECYFSILENYTLAVLMISQRAKQLLSKLNIDRRVYMYV